MAVHQLHMLGAFFVASMLPLSVLGARFSSNHAAKQDRAMFESDIGIAAEQVLNTVEAGAEELSTLGHGDDPDGVTHLTLKAAKPLDEIMKELPGRLTYLLDKKPGLMLVFKRMMTDIGSAPRGKTGAWKGSAIKKVIYDGNYEKSFAASKVSLYLTRKHSKGKPTAIVKLYFVDEAVNPSWKPKNRYSDAHYVRYQKSLSYFKDNVFLSMDEDYDFALQIWDDRHIPALKADLPVDLLSLFDEAGAMDAYRDFATAANSMGKKLKNVDLALLIEEHKQAFHAKGIRIALCNKMVKTTFDQQNFLTWLQFQDWNEYMAHHPEAKVDIGDMTFQYQYDESFMAAYKECKAGKAMSHTYEVFLAAGFNVTAGRRGKQCGGVFGAEGQRSESGCKCPSSENIHCGNRMGLSKRKFESTFSLWNRQAQAPCTQPWYCSNTVPQKWSTRGSEIGLGFDYSGEKNIFAGDPIPITFDGITKQVPMPRDYRKNTKVIVRVPEWDCRYYERRESQCGLHDTDNFKAKQMCCGCGGGKIVGDDKIAYCAKDACMLPGRHEP